VEIGSWHSDLCTFKETIKYNEICEIQVVLFIRILFNVNCPDSDHCTVCVFVLFDLDWYDPHPTISCLSEGITNSFSLLFCVSKVGNDSWDQNTNNWSFKIRNILFFPHELQNNKVHLYKIKNILTHNYSLSIYTYWLKYHLEYFADIFFWFWRTHFFVPYYLNIRATKVPTYNRRPPTT
jgi:hypothetical protein